MPFFLTKLWTYRNELILLIQLVAKLRKSAQAFTKEYIRKKIKTKLNSSIAVVGTQACLLTILYWWNQDFPGLTARLAASLALWLITLYNLAELTFLTIPELRVLYRTLRGKTGYALKYFLEVSLVTELLRFNVIFLVLCLGLGISTRTAVGFHFSYVKPWQSLAKKISAPSRAPRL